MLFKLAMLGLLVSFSAMPVSIFMMGIGMSFTEVKPVADILFGGGALFALFIGGLGLLFDN